MSYRIGVFGLGTMGIPISCNFLADGNQVMGYDPFPKAVENMKAHGIQAAASPRELMEHSDVVFSILPEVSMLAAMADGEDGILAGCPQDSGKTIIDLTTSDPDDSVAFGNRMISNGVHYIDCGMTGGRVGAVERKLVMMAGGDKAVFDEYRPLLETIAKSITYIGPLGCGHRMKLLHNAVSNSTFMAVIETTVLGRLYGMDLQAMIDVFNVGNARSYATEVRFPKYIIPGTFDMGYKFQTGAKDFRMIMKIAERKNFHLEMSKITHDYYQYGVDIGRAGDDVTQLYNLLEERNTEH